MPLTARIEFIDTFWHIVSSGSLTWFSRVSCELRDHSVEVILSSKYVWKNVGKRAGKIAVDMNWSSPGAMLWSVNFRWYVTWRDIALFYHSITLQTIYQTNAITRHWSLKWFHRLINWSPTLIPVDINMLLRRHCTCRDMFKIWYLISIGATIFTRFELRACEPHCRLRDGSPVKSVCISRWGSGVSHNPSITWYK